MTPSLQRAFDEEMGLARGHRIARDFPNAFRHLERAHVIGQAHVLPHCQAHFGMLRVGWLRRDAREIVGQVFRIVAGALGSLVGRVPLGNTGGANVSPFRPMEIPEDLEAIIRAD